MVLATGIVVEMFLPTDETVSVALLSETVMLADFNSHLLMRVLRESCSVEDKDAIKSRSTLYVTLLPPLISKLSPSLSDVTGVSWSIVLELVRMAESTALTMLCNSSCVIAIRYLIKRLILFVVSR